MSKPVLLLTDRPTFEQRWRHALEQRGVSTKLLRPEALPDVLEADSVLVVDAGSELFDEDELLAHVGLARALHSTCAVVLPDDGRYDGIEELLEDLCSGLVAHRGADGVRLASALARRTEGDRALRFEYLAVSPRPNELLAILADGRVAVLARPVAEDDDGSEVASIALDAGAESATVVLSSGRSITLRAAALTAAPTPSAPPPVNGVHAAIAIDGVRLGARLRELRVAAGLTQAELARRTGIHRPNIARVEAGRHTPSLETLARLASAIGVSTTTVLAEK
jgi:DNA-binding XRE family transcriptional regulator